MRQIALACFLALALSVTAPAMAAEDAPFEWTRFDVVEWVFDLLEIFSFEVESDSEAAPAEPPGQEMDPGYDPGSEEGPTAEIGPIADPIG